MLSMTAILKIPCLRNIWVSTNLCFLDDTLLYMSRGQEAQFPLTASSEEAVFGSLQKKEWLQSPRPLDPWDSWGSDLFQLPISQKIGSSIMLLCPFPAETVKPLAPMQKNMQNLRFTLMQQHSHCCTEQGQYLVQLVFWSNWKKLASDLSYLFCIAGVIFPEGCSNLGTSSIQSQPYHKDVHLK